MTTVGPARAGTPGEPGRDVRDEDRVRERPARRLPSWALRPDPQRTGWRAALTRTVPVTLITAAVLHVLWFWIFANSGGDLAAQDAWAEFALQHPSSAYNLAWYGGMHPVSYSVISPYLMAVLGVRTTMMIAGTLSAGLIALILVRSRAVRRPLWPALYGAFALTCNAISGRVTFGLGMMFGLAAVAVIFAWPVRWRSDGRYRWPRAALAGLLAGVATASSPVAGLYVGIVAAALWLGRRRPAAYALGVTPVIVVALSAWLFPFSGQQPMAFPSAILPLLAGVFGMVLVPAEWRTVRVVSGLYVLGVLLVWLIPSQIGTNISRLGMVFGGVVLVAVLTGMKVPPRSELLKRGRTWTVAVLALLTCTVWQSVNSISDIIHTTPAASWARELAPLVDRLQKVDAARGRVEVVPARSHREASALTPYVNLARGWNRQADLKRNPLFYEEGMLTPDSYRAWLSRWAVAYVVLPTDEPDNAAVEEAKLVAQGQPYLRQVWSDDNWRLYEVKEPTPLAEPPAVVERTDPDGLTISVKKPGPVLIRVPYSPWLGLVDAQGKDVQPPKPGAGGEPPVNVDGCLTKQVTPPKAGEPEDDWTVLRAPHAGSYRIVARYKLPRGTGCPDDMAR
ncbi:MULTISPECIES: MFS transporter [Streptomyces]|uniref:MFS transporter n=1 Tax=Streptomyces morookaense TaxID=1970 RepID=A0A7Y7B529_STRMO|nr:MULTISPECIES: MFS transporter [Streptomyces]MCC2278348.1 MFS transporter [Streptomyces sp. ET3-23]NVK79029.1 MFS transporter [Streptomyces morookaense]GHF09814.1 MFS transporter [Streptomyces morookaense]